MSKQSINEDDFLKNQGIEVEESTFLRKVLEKKAKGDKQQYNLRDLHGIRLRNHWQPGDTFAMVVKKLMIQRVTNVFDPDTYTEQSFRQTKELVLREKVKIMGILICLMLPVSFYFNFIKPKLNHIRRQYFLQFYNKMGFFNKELGAKTKNISQKDLEKNL